MSRWFGETNPTPEEDAERNELEKKFELEWRPGTPEYAKRVNEERAREEERANQKTQILKFLEKYPAGAKMDDIHRRTSIDSNTVYDILVACHAAGEIDRLDTDRRFRWSEWRMKPKAS
jgi:hypothetical protein